MTARPGSRIAVRSTGSASAKRGSDGAGAPLDAAAVDLELVTAVGEIQPRPSSAWIRERSRGGRGQTYWADIARRVPDPTGPARAWEACFLGAGRGLTDSIRRGDFIGRCVRRLPAEREGAACQADDLMKSRLFMGPSGVSERIIQ